MPQAAIENNSPGTEMSEGISDAVAQCVKRHMNIPSRTQGIEEKGPEQIAASGN